MNAILPLSDKSDAIPGGPDGAAEDLDTAFDAFLVRYATHLIPDGEASGLTRPELLRLIAPPEVTFAACLADGAIVLCCPEGLPRELSEQALPLEPRSSPPSLLARKGAALADQGPDGHILQRLAEIDNKIDRIAQESSLGARLADHLERLGSAIMNGLERFDRTEPATPDPFQQLVLTKLDGAEGASATQSSALSGQMQAMEARIADCVAKVDTLQCLGADLRQIEGKLDLLAMRPVPNFDLAGQRKGFASFLDAMGAVVRRIDMAADRLVAPPWDNLQVQIADIGSRMNELQATRSAGPVPVIDDIARDVAAIGPTQSELLIAIDHLGRQIEGLGRKGSSQADVASQLGTLSDTMSGFSGGIERLDARLEELRMQFAQMAQSRTDGESATDFARLVAGVEELAVLSKQTSTAVADLAARPSPTIDMTNQRKGLAQFGFGLSAAVQRLENVSATLSALTSGAAELEAAMDVQAARQIELLQAIQTLQRQTAADPSIASGAGLPTDHALIEYLRNMLAETIAMEIRSLAVNGVAVVKTAKSEVL